METKLCNVCGIEKPLPAFRRKSRGSDARRAQCKDCFNRYMAGYRQAKKHRQVYAFVGRLSRASCRDNAAEKLCREMLRRLGGLDRFCTIWKQAIDDARARNPGSALVLKSFGVIVRLVEVAANQDAEFSRRLSIMPTEELEEAVIRYCRRALEQGSTSAG